MRFKKLHRLKIATYIFFVKIFVRPSKVELDANAKFHRPEKKPHLVAKLLRHQIKKKDDCHLSADITSFRPLELWSSNKP